MSVMASMLFSAYKWLLLEELSGISINCAQQTRQVLTVSAQRIRHCSGQASRQAHSQRWFSCAKQATVQRVVGPLDVASRSQSRQPSEISRQAAIRHAQARSRARPSSGGFMRLQKTRTQNRVQNAVKICSPKIRIQDFTDLQGSRFYRKQILTAACTLFSVLVFCHTKRLLYYMDGFCTTRTCAHRIGSVIRV